MNINSNSMNTAPKQEEKKDIQPVVSAGSAKRVKPSNTQKVAGMFFGGNAEDIKEHIVQDVVVPTVRNGLHTVISSFVDSIFGGPASNTNGRYASPYNRENYTSYSSARSSSYSNRTQTNYQRPDPAMLEYDQIVFKTMGDAQMVLDQMYEVLREYGIVTIADLIKLARVDDGSYVDNNWTDNNYGWKYLRPDLLPRYSVMKQGYILPLSQPIAID